MYAVSISLVWNFLKVCLTDEQERGVHDGGAVQHRGHQDVVTGAVDEADVTNQVVAEAVHDERVLLGRPHRGVARRPLALGVVAAVDLGVGIAELNGDVALELILTPDGVDAGQSLDDGRLAVSHVTDGADVDGRLPENEESRLLELCTHCTAHKTNITDAFDGKL